MENFRAIRRALWITLGLNLVATAAKLIVGYWTGSLSLIADSFDSVFDSASNVIGLVGIYVAAQPADKDHPYGHRKAETMTALIFTSLLFLTTWELKARWNDYITLLSFRPRSTPGVSARCWSASSST